MAPAGVWWGKVDGAMWDAPYHIMVPDPDYRWASMCKGRPSDGYGMRSGSMDDVNQCAYCLNNAPL